MMNNLKENALSNLQAAIEKLDSNKYKLFFYVFDTKGTPSGSLSYIYETALSLQKLGYNVQMLHNEDEFVGVEEWMGEEYAKLPHQYVGKNNISMSPSDFLFIPEIYSGVMAQTKTLPCKRIVIFQNTNYFCDTIAVGGSFDALKIYDCVTTSSLLENKIKEWFPLMRTNVVHPFVPKFFVKNTEPKKMFINVISKSPNDINTIIKPFFWKYPNYKWVSFAPINNFKREDVADSLKKSPILLWVDEKTDFGHVPLEAMACNNIIIGKIPENEPEWMLDEDGIIRDNGLWFYKNSMAVDMIANAIETVINDAVPEKFYEEMENTVSSYTYEKNLEEVKATYGAIIENRKKELEVALSALKNNLKENEE